MENFLAIAVISSTHGSMGPIESFNPYVEQNQLAYKILSILPRLLKLDA
jgi:hypothetical protein